VINSYASELQPVVNELFRPCNEFTSSWSMFPLLYMMYNIEPNTSLHEDHSGVLMPVVRVKVLKSRHEKRSITLLGC